jgi:hypothetical protein
MEVQGQSWRKVTLALVVTCDSSYMAGHKQEDNETNTSKILKPYLENNQTDQKGWGVTQMVEWLSSKHEAQCHKKKKKPMSLFLPT